jgi:predicted Fe-Mo cluster-binding NifX family protein
MKIAIASGKGKTWDSVMDPRFGRTEYFFILNEDNNEVKIIDNSEVNQKARGTRNMTVRETYEDYKSNQLNNFE